MNLAVSFLKGLELSFFLDKVVLLLFVLSLFSMYAMKDWAKALNVFTVFFVSFAAVLCLAILEIIYVDKSIVTIAISSFILVIAVFNLFSGSSNNNSRRNNKEKYRKPLAGISGVLCSFFIQNVLIGRSVIADFTKLPENILYNVGVIAGLLGLVIIILILGSIFTITIGIKKKEWLLLCTGASVGIVIFLMS